MSGYDWFGTPARLIPVRWGTALETEPQEMLSVQEAPGRRWVFVAPYEPLRSWSLEVDAKNEDLAVLQGFLGQDYGLGPFTFISDVASFTNVLTPAESALEGLSKGSMDAVGGFSPTAVVGPASVTVAKDVSVLPAGPVTVSMDVTGQATLTVQFKTAAGARVGDPKTVTADGALLQRLSWQGIAPGTARLIDISIQNHLLASRPQVTWTEYVPPFARGMGCKTAMLQSAPFQMKKHHKSTRNNSFTVSAKIIEVNRA